jgi:hypothetical protein
MSWQKAIILNPNEQVLHSWDGNCEHHQKTIVQQRVAVVFKTNKVVDAKHNDSGTLALTNQRLIWFERTGTFSKVMRASMQIDLLTIQGITTGGTLIKWVSITDMQSENIFHLKDCDITSIRDLVIRQMNSLRQLQQAPQVAIQKETITKEVVMIPCKYCSGLMPQTSVFCPNCGAQRKG